MMASKCEMSEPSTETLCEPPKRFVTDDSGLTLLVLRKKLVRRALPDHSQALRRSFQFLFLLLNVWLGAIFYAWVRHFETGDIGPWCDPPALKAGSLSPD